MQTIRGAITIAANIKEHIRENTLMMLSEMLKSNDLCVNDVESIIFTATKDIDQAYPAKYAREIGFTNATLMCMQEMHVEGSLTLCIRALMFLRKPLDSPVNHVYLKGATALRPDLIKAKDQPVVVAIDGPAGVGKSTIAKRISQKLGFLYIDTGAIYRGITYGFVQNHIDLNDSQAVESYLNQISLHYTQKNLYLDNQIIDEEIRSETISKLTSDYSKNPFVRKFATQYQQDLAKSHSVVMEGRDIGTVVFPNAQFKFFLVADPDIRGQRRYEQLRNKGVEISLDEIINDIHLRDQNDSQRQLAPLKKAEDAIEIDTSYKTIEEIVSLIEKTIQGED